VSVHEPEVADGIVRVRSAPSGSASFGKFFPGVDVPARVTGSFPYVHNVRVPSLLHGRVIQPPETGSSLVGFDQGSRSGVPDWWSYGKAIFGAWSPNAKNRPLRPPGC
jgi:hypothetical protein